MFSSRRLPEHLDGLVADQKRQNEGRKEEQNGQGSNGDQRDFLPPVHMRLNGRNGRFSFCDPLFRGERAGAALLSKYLFQEIRGPRNGVGPDLRGNPFLSASLRKSAAREGDGTKTNHSRIIRETHSLVFIETPLQWFRPKTEHGSVEIPSWYSIRMAQRIKRYASGLTTCICYT